MKRFPTLKWPFILSLLVAMFLLLAYPVCAQNCTTLYLIDGTNGRVYSITPSTGAKTLVTTMTTGRSNLAVGPTGPIFTSSETVSGSTVFQSNASIGTTLPADLGGFGANPTSGLVYGITTDRRLIKAAPAPAAIVGTVTGDAIFTAGTPSNDIFFDNAGNVYTVVTNGANRYLYRVNPGTLVATQMVQLSGSLPTNFQGLAYLNGKIYACEGFTSGFILTTYNARIYEINPNTGQGTQVSSVSLSGISILFPPATDNLDLASCEAFVPSAGPTCNTLYGIDGGANIGGGGTIYSINASTGAMTTTGLTVPNNSPSQGNIAVGPTPGTPLGVTRYVTSPNNASGTVYQGATSMAAAGTSTWGSPIGIATDAGTGISYGINSKTLSRWTGVSNINATSLGTVFGDAVWTSGATVNDLAADASGNLYAFIQETVTTNTKLYLYRINPATLAASLVQTSATNISGTGTINGMAYLNDGFYFSRQTDGSGSTTNDFTEIWKFNALTGAITNIAVGAGAISPRLIGDLASCATVTDVPGSFTFSCSSSIGGIIAGSFVAGTTSTGVLRVPVSTVNSGQVSFSLSSVAAGITSVPSPYTINILSTDTYVDIPVAYNGSGVAGNRVITVTSSQGTGTCTFNATVNVACAAGTTAPVLTGTTLTNACGAASASLASLQNGTAPAGSAWQWHTGNPATAANKVSDPTAITASGTYYAFFYDATNDCYSPVSAAVAVTINLQPSVAAASSSTIQNVCNSTTVNLVNLQPLAGPNEVFEWWLGAADNRSMQILNPATYGTPSIIYLWRKNTVTGCYSAVGFPVGVSIISCCAASAGTLQ